MADRHFAAWPKGSLRESDFKVRDDILAVENDFAVPVSCPEYTKPSNIPAVARPCRSPGMSLHPWFYRVRI